MAKSHAWSFSNSCFLSQSSANHNFNAFLMILNNNAEQEAGETMPAHGDADIRHRRQEHIGSKGLDGMRNTDSKLVRRLLAE